MRVLLHAPSAQVGGALNYIKAIAPELAAAAPDCEFLAVVPVSSIPHVPTAGNFRTISFDEAGALRRMWYDQRVLRQFLRAEKIDVLFSTANTGMLKAPCRQVLLVRNSLYFSDVYAKRMLPLKGRRSRLSHSLRGELVAASIRAADVVMTPSKAMMAEVCNAVRFPDSKGVVNHYGVDVHRFRTGKTGASGCRLRLLFTGLYSEHKNVGTLFEAMLELERTGVSCQLITPADPNWESLQNPIRQKDRQRAQKLSSQGRVQFTGVLPADGVTRLYGNADIFVYPCVVESFGHPLLEAMAAELPIVAADTTLNRELVGDAAVYFSPYDSRDFAEKIRYVAESPDLQKELVAVGRNRCSQFRWSAHIERLLQAFHGEAAGLEPEAAFANEAFQ